MRMEKSRCWEGNFSALSRGKVTILGGRDCFVPVNTASRACVWLLDLSRWGLGRLFASAVSTVPGHRLRDERQREGQREGQRERRSMTPAGRVF